MLRVLAIASSLLLLAGCALRHRYADFVSPTTPGEKVTFLLTEKGTGRPLPHVGIEVGELKNRVRVTTGDDGTFDLPVSPALAKDNPVIVVNLPRAVTAYELAVVTAPPAATEPPATPEAPAAPAAPAAPETPAQPEQPATPPSNG